MAISKIQNASLASGVPNSSAIGSGTITQANLSSGVATTGPTFRAYPSTSQTFSGATLTKVVFDLEDWDTNNNFASSRFTPTVAGYYFISAGVRTNSAGGGEFVAVLTKNGNTWAHGSNNSATGINLTVVSTLIYMNGTTDYAEIMAYPGPNAATTAVSTAYVYFTGFLARAA